MERKQALLPICSGTLGLCCAALQLVAIATPHWAIFWSYDPLSTGGIIRPDQPVMERGYYGLWKLCQTNFAGSELPEANCGNLDTNYNPGERRYIAGAFAVGSLALVFVFLLPVPVQILFVLKDKGILPVAYRAITMIKIVTSCLGGGCAITAAVVVNFPNKNEAFEERKGWSFGLQIVVIVLDVFLLICSSAEHMVGNQYPKGPLTKCRQRKTEEASTNLAYTEKIPDVKHEEKSIPLSPANDILLEQITKDREINGRPVTAPSSYGSESDNNLEEVEINANMKIKKKKKRKENPDRDTRENSHGMQFHNPEFQASCESIEDSPNPKRNDKTKSYYFGNSMDGSENNFPPAPKFSLSNSNLSTVTARSTDV